jgi:hypothetical protein
MTTHFVALIGDAVRSRELDTAARARLQRELRAALPVFNRRWRQSLAARFAVTLGDEFQCLLTSAAPVWEIAHVVRATLGDVDWVIGCGRGPITTPLAKGVTAPELDGPCFHEARTALEAAKRSRRLFGFGGFAAATATLNGLASYYSALHWSWTPRQRRAAKLLRSGDPASAAAALRVSLSAVSHLSRRLAWPQVTAGDAIFRAMLADSHASEAGSPA